MEWSSLEGLMYGFSICFTTINLLAVLFGVLIGTLIGVLPGIGPAGALAILLPITLKFPAETSLIMLAGIYYGAMYGGSTTAILVNVPGEVASVVTCLEGYQMAKKGRAGAALAVSAVGSFVAGTIGVMMLMFFAPTLANFALSFGSPDFFALALLGLIALSRISRGSFVQGLFFTALGLMLMTIGIDRVSSVARFTFGVVELGQGIDFVAVVMGLYGVGEVLCVVEQAGGMPNIAGIKFLDLFPTRSEWRRSWLPILRGSGVGVILGLLPGPTTILSTYASYSLERKLSKHREEFGQGAIEGVAGPESANNAAATARLIPLLSLGIPFSAVAAMLLGALLMQGVQTGPLLISQRPEIFWGVVASMYIGNVALLLLNYPLVGLWVHVLRIPQAALLSLILVITFVGAYSLNNSLLDVIVLVVMGIVGYMCRKMQFDVSPLVLAMVLGPMLETSFRESLYMSRGNLFVFFQRPISGTFFSIIFIMLIIPPLWKFVNYYKSRKQAKYKK
jgi:putative tricarboxylic transport membrane protein